MTNSEQGRLVGTVLFKQNTPTPLKLPPDTGVKRINCRMHGSFQVTYASGSPVFDSEGIFSKLCPTVTVALDGNYVVKAGSPFQFQQLHYLLTGQRPEQRYSTQAGAFTTQIAGTDGRPGAFPATTQRVLDNETISIYFENLWAYGFGSDLSILNLMGQTNPEIRFGFASYGSLQDWNSASVSVTYADDLGLSIDVSLVEAQDIGRNDQFVLFREYSQIESYNAQKTGVAINLNVGNYLQGIMATVRNGDASKLFSNVAVTRFQLRTNGRQVVKDWPATLVQAENRARRAISAPSSSGTTFLDGTYYLQLIKNGDIRTALDLTPESQVRQCQLLVDTAATTGVDPATYTNNVDVQLMIQELILPDWLKKQMRPAA